MIHIPAKVERQNDYPDNCNNPADFHKVIEIVWMHVHVLIIKLTRLFIGRVSVPPVVLVPTVTPVVAESVFDT
jgi:hypothetical protein